jgi:pyrimidine-nucleoside phosphorylase
MLVLAGMGDEDTCESLARSAIQSGEAFNRFVAMVQAQGGDHRYLLDTDLFDKAPVIEEYRSLEEGYLVHMDAEAVGIASVLLGAGRRIKAEQIDHRAGLVLLKKPGDYVKMGEPLLQLHTNSTSRITEAEAVLKNAFAFSNTPPSQEKLLLAKVTPEGVKLL